MLICMALLEYSVCSPAFASVRGFDPHGKSDSAAEEALGEIKVCREMGFASARLGNRDEGLAVEEVSNSPLTSQTSSLPGNSCQFPAGDSFEKLLLDAQSRIGTWLSAVDAQADSTPSRSLPGQAETPDASEQVSPLPQPKVSAAARRLQEWRLTRESTLGAETEAPHAATVSAEPKQELGESGEAQPSDPFVEATVGEAVVRIRISEEESKTVAQLAATFERPSNVPKGKADVTSAMSKTPMQEQPAREAERADEAPKGPEDKVPSSAALQAAAGKLMERVKAAREKNKRPEEDGKRMHRRRRQPGLKKRQFFLDTPDVESSSRGEAHTTGKRWPGEGRGRAAHGEVAVEKLCAEEPVEMHGEEEPAAPQPGQAVEEAGQLEEPAAPQPGQAVEEAGQLEAVEEDKERFEEENPPAEELTEKDPAREQGEVAVEKLCAEEPVEMHVEEAGQAVEEAGQLEDKERFEEEKPPAEEEELTEKGEVAVEKLCAEEPVEMHGEEEPAAPQPGQAVEEAGQLEEQEEEALEKPCAEEPVEMHGEQEPALLKNSQEEEEAGQLEEEELADKVPAEEEEPVALEKGQAEEEERVEEEKQPQEVPTGKQAEELTEKGPAGEEEPVALKKGQAEEEAKERFEEEKQPQEVPAEEEEEVALAKTRAEESTRVDEERQRQEDEKEAVEKADAEEEKPRLEERFQEEQEDSTQEQEEAAISNARAEQEEEQTAEKARTEEEDRARLEEERLRREEAAALERAHTEEEAVLERARTEEEERARVEEERLRQEEEAAALEQARAEEEALEEAAALEQARAEEEALVQHRAAG
eukprot:s719_g19.t2